MRGAFLKEGKGKRGDKEEGKEGDIKDPPICGWILKTNKT